MFTHMERPRMFKHTERPHMFNYTEGTRGGGHRASRSTRPPSPGAHFPGVAGAETGTENKKADEGTRSLHEDLGRSSDVQLESSDVSSDVVCS